MKKMFFGVLSAIALLAAAPAAMAGCWVCPTGSTATFDYGAGGQANNNGMAQGDITGAYSVSGKDVYGGGDAWSNTGGGSGANAYAGSHFSTSGGSMALSGGWGNSAVATGEIGQVQGGGMAATNRTWNWGN